MSQEDTQTILNLEQKLEQQTSAMDEASDLSELVDGTAELLEHPLQLNRANTDELRASGLFSESQIIALILHREKFGDYITIQELQVIDEFSENFIRQLTPYVTTGKSIDAPNASLGRMLKDGSHQMICRWMKVVEDKRGYNSVQGPPMYQGNNSALYVRYGFKFMKKLGWGFTAEKDAGEQFFNGTQKQGFDYYSFHFVLRDVGIFKTIVVGDFQLEYGQGLTLCTGLAGGKPSDPVTACRALQGIRPYTSSNEVFFKRGAAVSLKRRQLSLDLFASKRNLDGNTEVDSLSGANSFTSIQESGLHRTQSEIADKHSVSEILYGSHIGYAIKNLRCGITGVQVRFDKPLIKEIQPYNTFEFRGQSLLNLGIDYALQVRNFSFFGEIARSQNGSFANLHGVTASVDPKLGFSVVYRDYPRTYQSLYSGGMREGGNNFNERGIYAGFNFKPIREIVFIVNMDRFSFPWLRYQADTPSEGYEFNTQVSYLPNRKTELYVRYRQSVKEENTMKEDIYMKYLVPVLQRNIRFHVSSKISKTVTLRTRVELVSYNKDFNTEKGMVIFQDFIYHPMASPISFNFRYGMFDTGGYNSRLYAYENDVLYGYSIPAYYNKGSRICVNVHYRVTRNIDFWIRYAATFYNDIDVIGSSYEEIEGTTRSDVKCQVRWEF